VRSADAVQVLGLEAIALKVTSALRQRAIDALVMKGPITNQWLYGSPLARRYQDIDLLISPASEGSVGSVLRELGFRNDHARVLGIHRPDYESSWTLGTRSIDLHTRIAGIPASRADDAWLRLSRDATNFRLHDRVVRTLAPAARTMLLGLHAARTKADKGALRDLEVGLSSMPESLWREAADMAQELGAASCFALGLRRCEAGRTLITRMCYRPAPTLESLLLEREAPQEALVIAANWEAGRRVGLSVVRAWFATEEEKRPAARGVLAALVRLPRALFMVFRLQYQCQRQLKNDKGTATENSPLS
jgi:hypothetical protein